MIDATMVVTGDTGKWRHRWVELTLMPAFVVVLPVVWLLKMDAIMAAVMQARHADSSLQALVPALVPVLPLAWLLKMYLTMAAVMQVRHGDSSVQTLTPSLVPVLPLVWKL